MGQNTIRILASDKHLTTFNTRIALQIDESSADLPAQRLQFGCEALSDKHWCGTVRHSDRAITKLKH